MNDTAVLRATRFSVLDRSLTRQGQEPALALRETVRFAQRSEQLGYHRFWVSEHHGVPGVAGSAPTVLAAAVAAATSHIRVGTGGVMLPNHQPFVVAEQFGVLASLFPGRIDMGLGRSVGFTDGVRRALGRDKEDAEDFSAQITELLGYFAGEQPGRTRVRALPAEGLRVPAFVLATGAGADIAAEHGLPLVIASPRGEEHLLQAIDRYRNSFRRSARSPRPHVVIAVSAAVAATAEEARLLQIPEAWAMVQARTRGAFPPLSPVEEILSREMTERERLLFHETRRSQVHGTEEEVAAALARTITRTGADEVLLTLNTYDPAQRLDAYRRLARLAGLGTAASRPASGVLGTAAAHARA